MPSLARKKFFVYELSMDRPGKYVFYVGKGSGRRPYSHDIEARNHCLSLKCAVIRYLYAQDDTYWIRVVYETDDEEEAYWFEMKTITSYPPGTLCNVFAGLQQPHTSIAMDIEERFSGWQRGYLVNTKTNERIYESPRDYPNSIITDLVTTYDQMVLPPYLEKIGYTYPEILKRVK